MLQSNNVGIVGEKFIKKICKFQKIRSDIDGSKTKKIGGGYGDGKIKDKNVEIKTSHMSLNGSFQHELGETPWKSDYVIFVDVSPVVIYITIFKNFTEQHYKSSVKNSPYFPTKSFCWRKKSGAFKLDTNSKINNASVQKGFAIRIDKNTTYKELGIFINASII